MQNDSLKRVLLGIKDEARSMRLGKLKKRLEPKEEAPPEGIALSEGSPEEEAGETPDVEALEVEAPAEAPADSDAVLEEIKKLLARV